MGILCSKSIQEWLHWIQTEEKNIIDNKSYKVGTRGEPGHCRDAHQSQPATLCAHCLVVVSDQKAWSEL